MTHLLKTFPASSKRLLRITKTLVKEHLREPVALLWTGIAPCIMFLFATQNPAHSAHLHSTYTVSSSWFYAYMSASIAFFGFSFYLIGRRESGFIRSFIYQRAAIRLFLISHFISYSMLSLLYFTLFYLATKPFFGVYSATEFLYLAACFYTSYLALSCLGLIIAALPIRFGTASTLFSLASFWMLLAGYLGATSSFGTLSSASRFNPLYLSMLLFSGNISLPISFLCVLSILLLGFYLTARHFRIQPVWSRY